VHNVRTLARACSIRHAIDLQSTFFKALIDQNQIDKNPMGLIHLPNLLVKVIIDN
jgi:hypothetical protein